MGATSVALTVFIVTLKGCQVLSMFNRFAIPGVVVVFGDTGLGLFELHVSPLQTTQSPSAINRYGQRDNMNGGGAGAMIEGCPSVPLDIAFFAQRVQ